MLFNSIEFAIFLPIVFLLYWYVFNKSIRIQNAFLIAVSYFFYGYWDWRFLGLIAFSSLVDFLVGLGLNNESAPKKRKALLLISVLVNLGFLGFFKYYNFFSENFAEAFTLLGSKFDPGRLDIILPVGISFYTFQTLSYTFDVYRKKIHPTRDALSFFAFVSFFPQLVAGPIERATKLLPQFYKQRNFDAGKAVDGMRQILWGLVKKMVIADNCAYWVNIIFENPEQYSGSTLALGAILFSFQIYGDFSGYSDIAIGSARLLGFDLMKNFSFPYFSRDIAEFWRRWHISLSTWFRDYLYIPLGGSRGPLFMQVRNTIIVFVVSGFWHGAQWTFIIWGLIHALYFLPLLMLKKNRTNLSVVAEGKMFASLSDIGRISFTFLLTAFAWIFFRANSLSDATIYVSGLFNSSILAEPEILPIFLFPKIIVFVIIEWVGRHEEFAIERIGFNWPRLIRWIFYSILAISVLTIGGPKQEFIYFQF